MMKVKLFLIISLVLLAGFKSYAQYGNVWAFGDYAGIDFNNGTPQVIKTSIRTSEGCASVCNTNGQLLFYTDGNSVWDRNNNLMPNGTDLPGMGTNITSSTTQGALIVPMPGDTQKYYIFSLGAYESGIYRGKLYYSVVDMSLHNGLGDVSRNGTLLDSSLTEHMMAVSGNNCDIWLLVASQSDRFKAYDIDLNGINSPVISPKIAGGGTWGGIIGSIDIAPDRSKLAMAQGNLVLYDFDPDLGTISNPLVLDKSFFNYYYGVAFSPDNTRLYASTNSPLYQFNLSLPDNDSIVASKTLIANVLNPAIKRGPDDKIYIANSGSQALNVINQPNLAGTACQYVANGLPLLSGTRSELGLPNSATIVTHRKLYRSQSDTAFCTKELALAAHNSSGMNYTWEDGSTGSTRHVDHSGIYWVSYQVSSPCMFDECVDTFKVFFDFSTKEIYTTTVDSGICKEDTILLKASDTTGSDYTWENGSMGMQRSVNRTGIYWLRYQIDSVCEAHVDSFIITYPEKDYEVSFSSDTLICQNNLIHFRNTSDPHFNEFKWFFGDQDSTTLRDPQHLYIGAGAYEVMLTGRINEICMDTASRTIIVDTALSSRFLAKPDSICAGETITFFSLASDSSIKNLSWQFGDGTKMNSGNENQIQHAYETAGIMPVKLNMQFRICPDTSFTDTVYVYDLPKVYLGPDTNICLHDAPIILQNGQTLPAGIYHYHWNTGDTTESLKVVHPGIYSLTINNEPLGCRNTAQIKIAKGCYINIPNAFTPNGDGANDYFFPRQLLSEKLTRFNMQIFNRWGQLLFETSQTDGRGWDGRFNGKMQPEGVYIYVINAEINGVQQEHYEGNVTLIR